MSESYPSEPEKAISFLSDISPKAKVYDTKKATAVLVEAIYDEEREFSKLSRRMSECGHSLGFAQLVSKDTGELSYKLKTARFCHVRLCPLCSYLKMKRKQEEFLAALPNLLHGYSTHRFLLLGLTVPCCKAIDLKATISEMNRGWKRLTDRKEFSKVDGWVKSTEITHSKSLRGDSHPHFHILLMVKPSYFTHGYVKHIQWLNAWQECMRDHTITQVDIQAIRGITGIKEVLKYSLKDTDIIKGPRSWFFEMTRQIRGLRFIAAGGLIKDMLKMQQDKVQEAEAEAEAEDEPVKLVGTWTPAKSRYRADWS